MYRVIVIFIILYLSTFAFGQAPENKTIASYDPSELLSKIFKYNDSIPSNTFGSVQFEGDNNDSDYFYKEIVTFKDNNYPDVSSDENKQNNFVSFQNDNKSELNKRKRRKRKPKQQYYGLQNLNFRPDLAQLSGIPNPGYGAQYYKPSRPRPSIASDALSAVTDALTSIALYDDQQCVPRLLCEAAGGGALGGSGILQTLSGIQPLLTLLSAYNGVSTNPLFVFGRAVFLGMSSNGNTASCRYAYPLCPTDPEQLVYYLNNHNGGFFRFFNSPQQGQQNVEQFYNRLSQNYGLYQQHQPQKYGFHNPDPGQNYGLQKPNLYSGYGQQNYGLAFPYNDNNNIRFKNSEVNSDKAKIQRRIQNKPLPQNIVDSEDNIKWIFPEAIDNDAFKFKDDYKDTVNSRRDVKMLKFPENYYETVTKLYGYERNTGGFTFPDGNNNQPYVDYNYVNKYYGHYVSNNQYYDNNLVHNGNRNNDDLKGITTVYVVRGNGDPSNPEVIKLRPGEKIQ